VDAPKTSAGLLADPPSVRAEGGAAGPFLAIEGIVARRGGRTVLDGVSFAVDRGEILGILGPNGAGKTTLFSVLTGALSPSSGRLLLEGMPLPPGDRRFLSRAGIVFQEPALDSRLTARENLLLAAGIYRVPRAAARDRASRLLAEAGLSERADEPVSRLSGGMRRKVEIARALVHEPAVLILDEPTTGLDEAAFRSTWDRLLALKRERRLTMLLTTHRPDEAERCDRIAIVDSGRVVACDSPDRLRERVRGDLLVIEAEDLQTVARTIEETFGVRPWILEGKVVLERERGHELIPRLVEALPGGSLRSIGMRRTGMGEVFLEVTGHDLDGARAPLAREGDAAAGRGRER
jgi:ABC-2 type transport system ATP-binding protein